MARFTSPEPGERTVRRPLESKLPDDLLSAGQVARRLGISEHKVYDLAAAGQIPGAIRLGSHWRFSTVKIDRWLHGDHATEVQAS